MKMLVHARMPHEKFNAMVRDGNAEKKLKEILADAKPEAVYFTECDGRRSCIMIVDVKDASDVPRFSEPWFLLLGADVQFHVVMTPEDLGKAGLDALGKKWA